MQTDRQTDMQTSKVVLSADMAKYAHLPNMPPPHDMIQVYFCTDFKAMSHLCIYAKA